MSDPADFPDPSRNVPDAHLMEIGRVVVEWSFLEEIVDLAISGLLNQPTEFGRQITESIRGFRQRLQILRSLVERTLKDRDDEQAFKDVFKAVEDAYAERNRVAHAVWWGVNDPRAPALQFTRAGRPYDVRHPHDIRLIAIKIRSAADALTAFLTGPDYRLPPPWQSKRPWQDR